MAPLALTVLPTHLPRLVEALSPGYVKFVARLGERRQDRIGVQIRRRTSIRRKLIVREYFHLAKTQTTLDSDQLNRNVLTDQRPGTCEALGRPFVHRPRIPGAQWIPLQIRTAVSHSNLQILQRLMTAAAPSGDPHNPNRFRR